MPTTRITLIFLLFSVLIRETCLESPKDLWLILTQPREFPKGHNPLRLTWYCQS